MYLLFFKFLIIIYSFSVYCENTYKNKNLIITIFIDNHQLPLTPASPHPSNQFHRLIHSSEITDAEINA